MDTKLLVSRLVAEHGTRNPYTICKNLEIVILRSPLLETRGFYQCEDEVGIIHIAEGLTAWADEFVCAHELGHAILHKGLNRIFMDSRTFMVPGKYENSADKFACNLLFSEPPLLRESALYDWQLAECLNVSTCNLNARLIELGVFY